MTRHYPRYFKNVNAFDLMVRRCKCGHVVIFGFAWHSDPYHISPDVVEVKKACDECKAEVKSLYVTVGRDHFDPTAVEWYDAQEEADGAQIELELNRLPVEVIRRRDDVVNRMFSRQFIHPDFRNGYNP